MNDKKPKNVFKEGAISSEFIAASIAKHQSKTDIGAHNIFLGQVRADTINNKAVTSLAMRSRESWGTPCAHRSSSSYPKATPRTSDIRER